MTVLLTICCVGLLGYGMRAIFIVSLAKLSFPPLALRLLEYVAPAVMGALVMTMLTGPEGALVVGIPELAGLVLAAEALLKLTALVKLTEFGTIAPQGCTNPEAPTHFCPVK